MCIPKNIRSVNHHGPNKCYLEYPSYGNNCKMFMVPENFWHLNHYRDTLKEKKDKFTIMDKAIWKFGNQLTAAVNETLEVLKLEL